MTPPPVFVITDESSAARARRGVRDTVAAALEGGAPAILLRDKSMPDERRRRLGIQLAALTRAAGAQLWVTGDADLAASVAADGLHLPATTARPAGWTGPWSRSCHDAAEVERARQEGAAHAFVAPVAATASKPGYGPALGPDGLRALVEVADGLPVVALGGVRPDDVACWRAAGATAVAVMGSVMAAADPAAVVRSLLDASRTAPVTDPDELSVPRPPEPPSAAAPSPAPPPSEPS